MILSRSRTEHVLQRLAPLQVAPSFEHDLWIIVLVSALILAVAARPLSAAWDTSSIHRWFRRRARQGS